MMSGNHTLTLEKASLLSPILHFWWSHELESKNDASQGIEIKWLIKNRSMSDLDEQGNNHILGEKSPNEVMTLVLGLVKQSKINKVDEKQVWSALLNQRWTVLRQWQDFMNPFECLEESFQSSVIMGTIMELGLLPHNSSSVSEEDLAFGIELYSVIYHCPSNILEAAKLAVFFESLLTNYNLNTVVAATLHNIQPNNNVEDFTAINMWYERLEERYNFSLGPAIIGLMTSDNLMELSKLDPPYLMKDYKDLDGNITILFGKI